MALHSIIGMANFASGRSRAIVICLALCWTPPLSQVQRGSRTICASWVRRWPHWMGIRSSREVVQIQPIGSVRDSPAVYELRDHCVPRLQPVHPACHVYGVMRRREHSKTGESKVQFRWDYHSGMALRGRSSFILARSTYFSLRGRVRIQDPTIFTVNCPRR
jgi:hypothetical protein